MIGTLQQTYKNNGISTVPTSMQTQKPFGGDNWSNDNLTTKESTLLNWIGKEKDNESKLGDHGVRKYEYETGRFISIDPLWANYFGWTPYQYSQNSPTIKIDFNGRAFITTHNKMDQEAELRVNGYNIFTSAINVLKQLEVELIKYDLAIYHLDDMTNSDMRAQFKFGAYKDWSNHQDQDFYFHSNYIEIMIVDLNYKEGEIPLFEDLEVGSDTYNKVIDKIRTTEYPDKNGSNINHDMQDNVSYSRYTWLRYGTFYAKDDEEHPYHDEAYRLGVEATVRNLESENP